MIATIQVTPMTPGQLVRRLVPNYTFNRLALNFDFSYIPAGSFMMGSRSDATGRSFERPEHRVTLTKPFLMLRTEVTQLQYLVVKGRNPSKSPNGMNYPVENVSWFNAVDFCNELSKLDGLPPAYKGDAFNKDLIPGSPGYRLPTEAEWEYAAKAGTTGDLYGDLDSIAWHQNDATHPVAQKTPNAWNLYDMLGNVNEWVNDVPTRYSEADQVDPQGLSTGAMRALRGGGFNYGANLIRASFRDTSLPDYKSGSFGFRICRTLD